MENYLRWNNVFRLKCGHEKHDQHFESKTNSTVEVSELFQEKSGCVQKLKHFNWGPGTASTE